MGRLKDFVDIKKLVIAVIVVVFLLYCFISGNIFAGNVTDKNIPTREKVLQSYPMFDALNKIDPEAFESVYKEIQLMPYKEDKAIQNESILKVLGFVSAWFDANLGRLLNSASDEAVNKYGSHMVRVFDILLKTDPTGVQCFNITYPGVLGEIDAFKLKDDTKGMAYDKYYLNSIADSVARRDKVDRLPVEQIEGAISIINNKLVEKYGDYYYTEDPQELAKQPALACGKILDLFKNIMELDPHLSAEILRYINTPE
ncbi:hypothetical protein [Xenorhabdus bharatensis]|uniref:hypothetical protein n=1 Tax=Xenorhabdus bharatensis TaxID=3136256 RepID=UPI0030F40702